MDQVKITEAVAPLTSPVSQGLLFSGRVRLAFPGAAMGVGVGVGVSSPGKNTNFSLTYADDLLFKVRFKVRFSFIYSV